MDVNAQDIIHVCAFLAFLAFVEVKLPPHHESCEHESKSKEVNTRVDLVFYGVGVTIFRILEVKLVDDLQWFSFGRIRFTF